MIKNKKLEVNININANIKGNFCTDIHNYIFNALRAVQLQLSWICSKLTEPCLLPFGQFGLVCSPWGFASLHPYANPLLVPKVTKSANHLLVIAVLNSTQAALTRFSHSNRRLPDNVSLSTAYSKLHMVCTR